MVASLMHMILRRSMKADLIIMPSLGKYSFPPQNKNHIGAFKSNRTFSPKSPKSRYGLVSTFNTGIGLKISQIDKEMFWCDLLAQFV